MKIWVNAFKQFMVGLWNEVILCVSLLAPILTGLVIYFGVPYIEKLLCAYFKSSFIIKPYYPLLQLILICMPILMLVFINVMVVLEEMDNGTAKYLCVTPLGKKGYIMTRFFITSVLSMVYSFAVNFLFPLSSFTAIKCIVYCILFAMSGFLMGFFITEKSRNKVEGMALVKITRIVFLISLSIPYFVTSKVQFVLSFFPPFWIGRTTCNFSIINISLATLSAVIWYMLLIRKFLKKIV